MERMPSRVDRAFFEEVMKSYPGHTIRYCYQCGTCSSTCPVVEEMDIKPHAMVEMIKLGLKEPLTRCKAIWQCSTCYMCTERCPQGVHLTSIILELRDVALSEEIQIPDSVKESCKNVYGSGRLLIPSQFQTETRARLQLPPVVPIDTKPIRGIVSKTKGIKIVGVK